MKKQVLIGSRGSRLAQVQSGLVLSRLSRLCPDIEFIIRNISTSGDKKKTAMIEKLIVDGAFVKEIQQALLSGSIRLAVHSLKDMPVEEPAGLTIGAILSRSDPRDVLISRSGKLDELPPGSLIGSGSPRRTAQLLAYRPDLRTQNIRGNIDSRINKVDRGLLDGVILAAAGLSRLGWQDRISQYLPLEHFLPEPGQGALAVEVRAQDHEILNLIQPLNDGVTVRCVSAERRLLKLMGGGCSLELGALATIENNVLTLQGMIPGKNKLIYARATGDSASPEKVAENLAQELINSGAIIPEKNKS